MLSTMLLILKIIGIVLLIVLLLVMAAAAVVLFVPVRYSGEGSYKDGARPHLRLDATWILKILKAKVIYEDGLTYDVRILGRCILSSDRSGEPVPEEAADTEDPGDTGRSADTEDPGDTGRSADTEDSGDTGGSGDADRAVAAGQTETADQAGDADSPVTVAQAECAGQVGDDKHAAESGHTADTSGHETAGGGSAEAGSAEKTDASGLSWYDRIQSFLEKTVSGIRTRIDAIVRHIEDLREKADRLSAFLKDESHQRAFRLLLESLRKLIAHVRPRRIKGHALFGFEDPGMTGYILAALSAVPVDWKAGSSGDFEVIPMFDRKVMDIDASFRGRLKLIVPARLGLKIWFDKDFKKLYAEVTDGRK